MRVITLKRISLDKPDGTAGILIFDDGYPYFTTIELSWKNNQHDISRIKAGEYIASRVMSPKRGYEVYMLQGVEGRDSIEMHIANSINDILGCIGIGLRFGVVETKDSGSLHGIQDSKTAFTQFMAMLKNDPEFKLVIVDC